MQQEPSVQGPAQRWASSGHNPQLEQLEWHAAQGITALQNELLREGRRIDHPKGPGRKALRVLEDWLMPMIGGAALLFCIYMVSPSAWFGDTVGYVSQFGVHTDVETVNAANETSRFVLALVCGLLAGALAILNCVLCGIARSWRVASYVSFGAFSVFSTINVIYLAVNVMDGYEKLTPALWIFIALSVMFIVFTLIAYLNWSRGRHHRAGEVFATLDPAHRQALLFDRNAALGILVQRGTLDDPQAQRMAKRPFGRITKDARAA